MFMIFSFVGEADARAFAKIDKMCLQTNSNSLLFGIEVPP